MGETAHPFQTAQLDEELEKGTTQLKASKEAQAAAARARPSWMDQTIDLPKRGRQRGREAGPPDGKDPPINGPTPERMAKDPEWDVVPQQGGQALHRPKSVFDTYREHLMDLEVTAAERLRSDAEWSTRQRTICQRTYTGMVFSGSDEAGNADAKRAFGMARFQYVMNKLATVEGALAAAAALIIAVRRESDGRVMSASEFAEKASSYGSKNTYGPFTAGYLKCLCQWIHALQQDFVHHRDRGVENVEHQQKLLVKLREDAALNQSAETDQLVAKLRDALLLMEARAQRAETAAEVVKQSA